MDDLKQTQWFDSEEFRQRFHTDLPLGSFCGSNGTVIRLWAPTAQAVTLYLYRTGSSRKVLLTASLCQAEHGVWVWETAENLDGWYYDFDVTVDGITRRTADPWARGCGINGRRSMILDLRRTDPDGWQDDIAPAKTPENIIYELHIKDFSWDEAGGFASADRGKYLALCRRGTTLNSDGIHPTGLDYLKRLGVTHVQLLPIYDFGSVHEAGRPEQFNWGYDPVNYNVPEGSYATDARRGEVRIQELKSAIQALHANGFRVIMDVVYNHTYVLDSWLFRTVPWYFYRRNPDGTPSNGSGCGNDIASERSMCSRYILESVLYWAEEYHMDGFRFDLMGLLDVELMNQIQSALDEKFGTGEKLIYGEPWSAASTAAIPGTILGCKDNLRSMAAGAFCDNTRDAIKGGLGETDLGFVNGGGLDAMRLAQCIGGWTRGRGAEFPSPQQTITYLSCHDDWTLWDKLINTMDSSRQYEVLTPEILRANRMAAAINFCCQGHIFFLSGEEFARTKHGVKNSYRSPAVLNQLDWTRAWACRELVDYYRGLIALRMQLPGMCDKSPQAADRIQDVQTMGPDCVRIILSNGGRWETLLLLLNAASFDQTTALPHGRWQLLADGESSFRWQETHVLERDVRIPSFSVLIFGSV